MIYAIFSCQKHYEYLIIKVEMGSICVWPYSPSRSKKDLSFNTKISW